MQSRRAADLPGRRGALSGLLCLCLLFLAVSTFWVGTSAPNPSDSTAFTGAQLVPATLAPPASRGLVARAAGRDWKPGNVAKRVDYRAQAAAMGGGKKKKKANKGPEKPEEPEIFRDAPIIYNGKKVGNVNGTIAEYKVDIWSGAHPIWQGKKSKVLLDASSLTRFQEKFGGASDIFGEAGLEQLELNKKLKKEQEERERMGLKAY